MFLSFKATIFSFEEEGKKEENLTALEGEGTGPIHPKVESSLVKRDQYLTRPKL